MKPYKMVCIAAIAIVAITSVRCMPPPAPNAQIPADKRFHRTTLPPGPPTPEEAQKIATETYIFGYPLVLFDITKQGGTAVSVPGFGRAPINQFGHSFVSPNFTFRGVVSPNTDTLYSSAWLDLTAEPLVLSVPDTNDRFYLLPMYSAWSNVFASPGKRTTGTEAQNFAITGPGWSGTLPDGLIEIESPTNSVWIIGRFQYGGPQDLPAVNSLQSQLKLTPLSAWGTNYIPPTYPPIPPSPPRPPPVDIVASLNPAMFFGRMATVMGANPCTDCNRIVAQMARIGIVPGQPFDWNSLSPTIQSSITQGVTDGLTQVKAAGQDLPGSIHRNGWATSYHLGDYGTDYLLRAGTANTLFGANIPEDSLYQVSRTDADGDPYTGAHKYVLHFKKPLFIKYGTPPARAFWSITMYDNQEFLIQNSINRYALSSHQSALHYNSDGSLDIYIQNTSPGPEKESNWLPAPSGGFNLKIRNYWPRIWALWGFWQPPAVQKIE